MAMYTFSKEVNSSRIPELDGLRGIAILAVLSFHYINNQLIYTSTYIGKLLYSLTSFGWVGVDLFFVLSGFLIGSILIEKKGTPKYFSAFYIRRVVRILPNYYLFVVIFFLLGISSSYGENSFLSGNNVLPRWSYFLMIQNFFMAAVNNIGNAVLSITWSICIEEQFYILIPFIIYIIKKKWLPIPLLIFIIAAPIIRNAYSQWIPTYVLPFCRMDALSLGVLTAWFNHFYNLSSIVKRKSILFFGLFVFVTLTCAYLLFKNNDLGPIKHTLFAIVFSLSLVFALTLKNSWFCIILRNGLLRWVGAISYALYLFHYMILGLCHLWISQKKQIGISNVRDIIASLVAFGLSLLISYLIYNILEKPLVAFGKTFKYE